MAWLPRAVVIFVVTCLSVLFALGCALAALFELQGFGAPRDEGRPLYLASLTVAFVACVAAPVAVRRLYDYLAARWEGRTQ